MTTAQDLVRVVAFQGEPGANSDLACRTIFPRARTLPCRTFEDAFAAVSEGAADRAVIALENSIAGRVADVHHLMPRSGLYIVAEHFQPIHHQLLAPAGASLETLKTVHSHVQALQQCRASLRALGLTAVVHTDTAGAAADVAKRGDPTEAALAPSLAGEIYGLKVLREDMSDERGNTTRFVVLSRVQDVPPVGRPCVTTFVFRVRNVPAALYKALGGFATNGINLSKLESYMVGGKFVATEFYADADGHPEEKPMRLALEELTFFSREIRVLGTYPASPVRANGSTYEAD